MNSSGNLVAYWADRITAHWRQPVESFFEAGDDLVRAKGELEHGEWEALVDSQLPFGPRTARRLMAISRDDRLRTHGSVLPPSWRTIYEITKLTDEELDELVADGTINPECERSDITAALKKERRETRERELGAKIKAMPEGAFGVIYADPPWRFEPYSRESGMDRAADNHYPTEPVEGIAGMTPSAADDAVLFLWATVPMLPQALEVMSAWGFAYKSGAVWIKDQIGTGYWFRNRHELLLVGTKGEVPAPAAGDQVESVIEAAATAHSAKPSAIYEIIEAYFPTLPKLEMFARSGRGGWVSWGAEAPEQTEEAA